MDRFYHRCIAHCSTASCSHTFLWSVKTPDDLDSFIQCPHCKKEYKLDRAITLPKNPEIFTEIPLLKIIFDYHDFEDESL